MVVAYDAGLGHPDDSPCNSTPQYEMPRAAQEDPKPTFHLILLTTFHIIQNRNWISER
jgi:hypothetical protein